MQFLDPKKQLEIILENVSEVIPVDELLDKLITSFKKNTPLKIKAGFDPTSSDLHLGHSLLLKKLKVFQDLGHEINFLIGDFTAMIGDPTGRDKTRKPLSADEIEINASTYKQQMFKVLDKKNVKIFYNSKWFDTFNLKELIGLSSLENVARLLERDDFKKRYKSGEPITVTEFLYPILQAYDSVVLSSDVELGGTDQRFNILLGRQIQKSFNVPEQVGVFLPILEGLDGKMKMSKSLNNYISLNDSFDDMFGKVMSVSDDLMQRYINLLFNNEISLFDSIESPLERKKLLGMKIVSEYYAENLSRLAKDNFEKKFSKKDFPSDLKEIEVDLAGKKFLDVLFEVTKESFSKSELKRLIKDNAVEVNGEKFNTLDSLPKFENSWKLKLGKRNFYNVKIK
ncbi:MAG: tyrosine--tRNA ligase [Thermodesulfobacteriota bacterium]|nr:tyrosine--tRNA ligase [Deltaproteobacteria bacterium TMED58]RZP16585.1 MAG: tyrosine--tRNA ligase [Candidatus Dadabacteria bacterium]|tara:strand:+ start:2166 stop:3359 length:1194 start_codon:yes stop_codon:yes gene_type:complete